MDVDFSASKVKHIINNENLHKFTEGSRVEIYNRDMYAYPYRHHYYNIELCNLAKDFYFCNGYAITGTFENIIFGKKTFFDCSTFKNVIFKNCHFKEIDVRWCKFINCKFIDCTGEIYSLRASTFKKDCIFENTTIKIGDLTEYLYFNSERYTWKNLKKYEIPVTQTTEKTEQIQGGINMCSYNMEFYIDANTLDYATKEDCPKVFNEYIAEILVKALCINGDAIVFCKCSSGGYNLSWVLSNGELYCRTFSEEELLHALKNKVLEYKLEVK